MRDYEEIRDKFYEELLKSHKDNRQLSDEDMIDLATNGSDTEKDDE